jgi:hypothetical protein
MSGVPATLDAVLDPRWLRHALDDVDPDDRIIEVEEIDSSQTLAQKVRFLVTVERADGARQTRASSSRTAGVSSARTRRTRSTPRATASVSWRASTRARGGASSLPTSPGSRRVS